MIAKETKQGEEIESQLPRPKDHGIVPIHIWPCKGVLVIGEFPHNLFKNCPTSSIGCNRDSMLYWRLSGSSPASVYLCTHYPLNPYHGCTRNLVCVFRVFEKFSKMHCVSNVSGSYWVVIL